MTFEPPPAKPASVWQQLRRLACSLRGKLCPACGKSKRCHESLCGVCYLCLPRAKQRALYKRIGEGYEEALADAFEYLDVTDPAWPADESPTKAPKP